MSRGLIATPQSSSDPMASTDRSNRRIKPHGFVDDRAGFDQTIDQGLDGALKFSMGFRRDALPPFGRLREQIERPTQGVGGCFMSSRDECDDVGTDLRLAHALPGFGISRLQEKC